VAGVSVNRSDNLPKYWPAYMLRDWDQERAGRITKEKKKPVTPARAPVLSNVLETSLSQKSLLSAMTDLGAASESAMMGIGQVTATQSDPEASCESVFSFKSDDDIQRTVGLLIIGDEILKGIVSDTNTQAAAKALYGQNVLLSKVVVCSDDQEEIVAEIKRLQRDVDVIITSGGVGPTHDDVTMKSVAAAMDRGMVFHEEMARLLIEKMNNSNGEEPTEAQIKMATLPSNAKLRYLSENPLDWPVLQCRNCFILPGVPQFFEKKVADLAVYLSSQLERSITYKVVLSVDEASIVDALNGVVSRHPQVSFGSYPFMDHPAVKTVLTLEGTMIKGGLTRTNSLSYLERKSLTKDRNSKEEMDYNVRLALDDLINALPKDSILRVDNNDGLLFS
jgi:molybdenum cofactor synthesis domain-containing protein